ncbi:MAG: hypothetical protein H6834_17240 [Planctomycetes bacterium]|nr:hypothetical protein [Planctomycetota bacterium]
MRTLLALLLSFSCVHAQDWTSSWNADRIRLAVTQASERVDDVERAFEERMRERSRDPRLHALFGYDPPGSTISVALGWAHLHAIEKRSEDAHTALALLVRFANYRSQVPDALIAERVEYAHGLPAVPSFFQLQDYAHAYRLTKAQATEAQRAVIEGAIAGSADFVFTFPEWGAHNRAMLRAECLLEATLALPDHVHADRWRRMSDTLARDSIGRWEVEDAQGYHPIWWQALTSWATLARRDDVLHSIPVRFYPAYWLDLIAPDGMPPDFGDAHYGGSAARYLYCFTSAARLFRDPQLQWAAERVHAFLAPSDPVHPDLGCALAVARLRERGDDPMTPGPAPDAHGVPGSEELVAKKVVLRTGFGEPDAYLLLNYRDEGDFGWPDRRFLRETLAVEEEKMHHGHADENAIARFMDGPNVLLRDAGYRPTVPSGPYGAYRADLFHNRTIVRRGMPSRGQSLLEFARDSGAYERTRTQAIDRTRFTGLDVSRTRVEEACGDTTTDRTVVFLQEERTAIVVDTVFVHRAGFYTFAQLFHGQHLRSLGTDHARLANTNVGERPLPIDRELLVLYPPGVTLETFPIERHGQDEHCVHQHLARHFDRGEIVHLAAILVPAATALPDAALLEVIRPRWITGFGDDPRAVCLSVGNWTVGIRADLEAGRLAANVRPRSTAESRALKFGTVETDADFVALHTSPAERRWMATHMTRVRIGDEVVFEAPLANFFQPSGRSDYQGRAAWRSWEETMPR